MSQRWLFWPLFAAIMGFGLGGSTTLPTRNGRFPIKPLPNEVFAIEEETAFLWAFGYLSYADFWESRIKSVFAADGSVMVPNRMAV